MSVDNNEIVPALLDLVRHYAEAGMSESNATRLAIATLECDMLNDGLMILGDIADALNDMRPIPGSRELH